MTETQSGLAGIRGRPLPIRGVLALLAAVLVNAALVWVVGAVDLAPDFRALTYPPVVFLSALGALDATAVYALLGRFVDDVDRTFTRVAAVVVLLVMHVVVAVASVASLVCRVSLR